MVTEMKKENTILAGVCLILLGSLAAIGYTLWEAISSWNGSFY